MDLEAFFKCHGVQRNDDPYNPIYNHISRVIGLCVWVCDFRFNNNGDIKPIRNVEPVEVMVCSNEDLPGNKRVYYSPIHFRPVVGEKVLSKVIGPYDNTGYRAYPGTSLNIFLTKFECYDCYITQCDKAISQFIDYENRLTLAVDAQIQVIKNLEGRALLEYSKC